MRAIAGAILFLAGAALFATDVIASAIIQRAPLDIPRIERMRFSGWLPILSGLVILIDAALGIADLAGKAGRAREAHAQDPMKSHAVR